MSQLPDTPEIESPTPTPTPTSATYPFTLRFKSNQLEQTYLRFYAQWLRGQSRIAIIVGMTLFVMDGLIDLSLSNPNLRQIWALRLVVLVVGFLGLVYTHSSRFQRHNQLPMAVISIIAASGLIGIQLTLGGDEAIRYFPSLLIATFWAYLFLGMRFTSALGTGLFIALIYNLSLRYQHLSGALLLDQNFDLFATNIIGGFSSYFSERQRRTLFHQQCLIDRERLVHRQLALEDELTQLPNRRHLEQSLEHLLAADSGRRHSGLFIDIDQFKPINDRFGHEVGDIALRILARRIRQSIRDSDVVCRLGGDEFFVILLDTQDTDAAVQVADKLLLALQQPLAIESPGGKQVHCTVSASLGIIDFPFERATVATILKRADQAMYRAKAAGRSGYTVFDPALDELDRTPVHG